MNSTDIMKGAGMAVASGAAAGIITGPILLGGMAIVGSIGILGVVCGVLASDSKEATIQVNPDGFEGSFKK